MAKTIVQKVVFKNTTAKNVYDVYMNPKKHSMVTGAPAKISAKEGAKFSAHGGYITGRNLHLIKDKLIVQSWRGSDWSRSATDSTFIIYLEQKGKDVALLATHANVPDKEAPGVNGGWRTYYWNPMKRFLAGKKPGKVQGM
ncbi:MAG TPA: SRPBCC domain-containing protein [Bacteroidota bacterium]|nr:SRPBCC domain-containing protein [Bacteroidota bacterium]